ncbi:TIGR02466 family protein [Jannaschia sp. 2305UL9-9]|uniref:TIGR02466 family protein n=1 Tax=Jannaschia sp. 2305UL9-9 TaxID=3121638 RepID=UPI0035297B2A
MSPEDLKFVRRTYFPTMIFQIDLPDPQEMNARLISNIYAERERDRKGISRSNLPQLGGWHSHNNLHKSKDFAELVTAVKIAGEKITEDLGYSTDHRLSIGTMWSIINPPGSANRAHVHPSCLWSGVYYIQAPEKSGDIEFIEPRTVHLMNQAKFQPNKKRSKENWTKVRFTPRAGRMLIFPSWLYHAVDPNMSTAEGDDANRIIVSFNINQTKK